MNKTKKEIARRRNVRGVEIIVNLVRILSLRINPTKGGRPARLKNWMGVISFILKFLVMRFLSLLIFKELRAIMSLVNIIVYPIKKVIQLFKPVLIAAIVHAILAVDEMNINLNKDTESIRLAIAIQIVIRASKVGLLVMHRWDNIIKGIAFWIVIKNNISNKLIVLRIDISHDWNGGSPILNSNIIVLIFWGPHGLNRVMRNKKEAADWAIKYFRALVVELEVFRLTKIGIKHSIFNSNRVHWINILSTLRDIIIKVKRASI